MHSEACLFANPAYLNLERIKEEDETVKCQILCCKCPLTVSRFVHSQMLSTSNTSSVLNISSGCRTRHYPQSLCARAMPGRRSTLGVFRIAGVSADLSRRDTSVTSVCLHATAHRWAPSRRPAYSSNPPHQVQVFPVFMTVRFMLCFPLPLISQHEYLINCL